MEALPVSDRESVLGGDEVAAPVRLAVFHGELVRALVGLGAGVGEEHPGVSHRGTEQAAQPFGEQHLPLVHEQVAGVDQLRVREEVLHRLRQHVGGRVPQDVAPVRDTASTSAGWACPSELTAMPAIRSRYSLPSASQTRAPSPRVSATGGTP